MKDTLTLVWAILYTAWAFFWGLLVAVGAIVVAFSASLVVQELRTSELQSSYLSNYGKKLKYSLAPGASDAIRFPASGPFDERFGYSGLPEYQKRLLANGFTITQQVRHSAALLEVLDKGANLPYREKTQAGLKVYDCRAEPIFSSSYPQRHYPDFAAVPPLLVESLLFIENRELLDPQFPKRNPAVEWDRFAKAVVDQGLGLLFPDHDTAGGSTLATQIEKYRHSPEGRTLSGRDKIQQMASASLRAYLDGPDTTETRKRIVLDYLNTVPLAARVGYGEVNGIGDGLWAWFGRDFSEASLLLRNGNDVAKQALVFKQALALMVAQRRPSGLLGQLDDLNKLTNTHIKLLANAGRIGPQLRDAALAAQLEFRAEFPAALPASFAARKSATTVRSNLAGLLGERRLYDLDRIDLTAQSTLHGNLQKQVTDVLRSLKSREVAVQAGLTDKQLLEDGDPSKVVYSFTLFERVGEANLLRVQTDSYDQPFDINEGTKLDLGSTAKFRTLVTYLEIIADLHRQYKDKSGEDLMLLLPKIDERDVLSRWAVLHLANDPGRSLETMLEAAMDREYSASPAERFETGGGIHIFANFNKDDNERVLPLREGFRNSVNLVFVRLMRDVARHYMFRVPGSSAKLLTDAGDPRRKEYLARFADREGKTYVRRFLAKYRGKTAGEAETLLMQGIRATGPKLAAIYFYLDSTGSEESLRSFVNKYMEADPVDEAEARQLLKRYGPNKFSLADRAYIAGVHPLELWVVAFLRANAGATDAQVLEASADERQQVYRWLFTTRSKNAQDKRILTLLETEGFLEVLRSWRAVGYPFESMVPSYASALGSSADRPAALAELMGIISNNGVRLPTVRLRDLHFAKNTPYETQFAFQAGKPERVLPLEVAQVARRALLTVVENGTARRLNGVFATADGTAIAIGGKTGTGDHRHDTFAVGGRTVSSKAVNRSATFMFFLGERHFGTVVAYVHGDDAAKYKFTSALAAQVLKTLAPTLLPFVSSNKPGDNTCSVGR